MKNMIAKLAYSGAAIAVSTGALYAQHYGPGRQPARAVPEIDASAGLLALAAVFVILAFVWERRRRAA